MSTQEQNQIKKTYYKEALRYMNNAKDTLKKAGKDGKFYNDKKYVKTACGTAYNGVLKALDGYLILKNVESPKGLRKSIEYYQSNIAKTDKKILKTINNVYNILHLSGYYDGSTSVPVIQEGFELAYDIIEKIKPAD